MNDFLLRATQLLNVVIAFRLIQYWHEGYQLFNTHPVNACEYHSVWLSVLLQRSANRKHNRDTNSHGSRSTIVGLPYYRWPRPSENPTRAAKAEVEGCQYEGATPDEHGYGILGWGPQYTELFGSENWVRGYYLSTDQGRYSTIRSSSTELVTKSARKKLV